MEDFIARELNNRQAYGALTWVVTMINNWKARREMRKLMDMSDLHLRDIGLSRHELLAELNRPLTANWDFERQREACLERHTESQSLPLSTPEGGQVTQESYLPVVTWLPSDENVENTAVESDGITVTKAKPMVQAIMLHSMAVAPV